MAYFPIFTDISQKKCMIVGGGKVALRKVTILQKFDADVHIIAEQVISTIEEQLPDENIIKGNCTDEELKMHLKDAFLVIAATSSRERNHYVAQYCKEQHIPVNVIDAPEECTFLFPSVIQRGDISIGINTAGKSPIVSKKIRKEIEKAIPDYYAEIAAQLGELKLYVKAHISEESLRREILSRVARQSFLEERIRTKEEIDRIIRDVRNDNI